MDSLSNEVPKVSDMIMCGDHSSFTKTALNIKEIKPELNDIEKDKPKEKVALTHPKISPTSSNERTNHDMEARALRARRRVRSLEAVQRPDLDISAPANKALVQVAVGSARWPPYLVAGWLLLLLLTHALRALRAVLDSALAALREVCVYFRDWTEDCWKTDTDVNHRLYNVGLACITAGLYVVYAILYVASIAVSWAIEPLSAEEDKQTMPDILGVKVTNYIDEAAKLIPE